MPSLVLCCRKSFLSGDDVRVFAKLTIAFRVTQLILVVPLLFYVLLNGEAQSDYEDLRDTCLENAPEDMSNQRYRLIEASWALLMAYTVMSTLLGIVGLVVFVFIHRVSGKGTPTEIEPRQYLPFLCHCHLLFFTSMRVVTFALGATTMAGMIHICRCHRDVQLITPHVEDNDCYQDIRDWSPFFYGSLVCHHIDLWYAGAICILFLWRRFPRIAKLFSMEARWECWCRSVFACLSLLTCCRRGGRESCQAGDMQAFADFMVHFFDDNGLLDVTASDVLAGLYMMHLEHVQQELIARDRLLHYVKEYREEEPYHQEDDGLIVPPVVAKHFNEFLEQMKKHTAQTLDIPAQIMTLLVGGEANRPTKRKTKRNSISESFSIAFRIQDEQAGPTPFLLTTLDPNSSRDRFVVAEGARFIHMAAAIYDWSKVDKDPSCSGGGPHESQFTFHPESDQTGRAVAQSPIDNISEEDIVYAHYKEGIVVSPYAIVLDHAWKSVVVTIRGTHSLEDVLADLTIVPIELNEMGKNCGFDGEGRYAHSGMLATAEWLYSDLQRHGLLDKLMKADDAKYKSYDLRITGHSLGAGCAVILSLLLREKFPDVRCLAFSPPGCTVCETLSKECEAWTTSYVLDSDVVPRSSLHAFELFRGELLETIARIKVPKYQVFANRNIHRTGNRDDLEEFLAQGLWDHNDIPSSTFLDQLRAFKDYQKEKQEASQIVHLHLPGKIIQLIRSQGPMDGRGRHGGCCSFESNPHIMEFHDWGDSLSCESYTARWAERDDFRRITLSTHFLHDHKTDSVEAKLCDLATIYRLQVPYNLDVAEK